MNMDFDPGMNVIVHAPPIAERANFSGTWVEQMINFDGQVGVILPNEPVMNEDGIAHFKVNILTIHQSVPVGGSASLTLSVKIPETGVDYADLVSAIENVEGVHYVKILARE